MWECSKQFDTAEARVGYLTFAIKHLKLRMRDGNKYSELPVDVWTFMISGLLLNMGDEIYAENKKEIIELCHGDYVEAVLTGGIGTGKTTVALVAIAYALYEMSCLLVPQHTFGLAKSSEILFVFQSLDAKKAKGIDYDRFKAMIDNSPYFQEIFRYDRNLTSEMRFPHRIIVKPLTGDVTAAIGQNVFGGIIDEVNFMAVVEGSSQSKDGGVFDQAKEIYRSINERRKSRFMHQGRLPGMLCMVSSKQYPGEFTDVKIAERDAELRETGKTTIYVYDKRVWEVRPEKFEGRGWFHIFLGDQSRKPRVLEAGEEENYHGEDAKLVMAIPEDYRASFRADLLAAIREVAGQTTLALHPFIMNIDAVRNCFGSVASVLSEPMADFVQHKIKVYPKRIARFNEPRFCHIDPSATVDSTGLAVGHVVKFVEVPRGNESEWLPVIQFDCILEVKPPMNGEIIQENLRRVLYALRDSGMLLKWVSMDGHQSLDSLQLLAARGFVTGYKSMDTDNMPYETAKQAFYDGRVIAPVHEKALLEWTRLEKNQKTMMIDHPANGSKDLTDAMAGVIYGLTMRREIWQRHGVPLSRVPKTLAVRQQKQADKDYITTLKRERSVARA